MEIFAFQYAENPLYRQYVQTLGIDPATVHTLYDIPFLPVAFFKTHSVRSGAPGPADVVFESSGTTGMVTSRHEVKDVDLYRKSFFAAFQQSYGPVNEWCIIGLLPAYLERSNSSLVFMVDELIRASGHPDSGTYLYDHETLHRVLRRLEQQGQKTLVIGVTFALLDFAEKYEMKLGHTVIMETGGMKGRRKEITRAELHEVLTRRLGVASIHAEYGMTELLSQAYSHGQGLFRCPPWMKVLVRKEDDPLDISGEGEGIVNIIDLANIWSCAFIATDDVGRILPDGTFQISGRVDNSDIRGCSLLVV
ncbi:MAG: acyl transferase [Bacteroidetes bacterium]|nr:acyl transferase [Bacteroidota bacterium]